MSTLIWEGDLEDDCTLRMNNLIGRCECLGELTIKGEEGESDSVDEYWHVAVYAGEKTIFHNGEPGGLIIRGGMARAVVEAIFTAYLLGKAKS